MIQNNKWYFIINLSVIAYINAASFAINSTETQKPDGWIDGWIDGWMDRWMDKELGGRDGPIITIN